MAGSPERPAVLRRLGIVKDIDDAPRRQDLGAPRKSEDALDLFAAENEDNESSPRFRGGLKWVRAAGVAATGLLRRSALLGIIAVFAIAMAGGFWLINRLFGLAPSTTETPSSAAAAESGTPAAESRTAPSSGPASKTPSDIFLPGGRRANAARLSADAVPGGQEAVRSQDTPLAAGRSAIATQPDQADGRAALQVPFETLPSSGDAAAPVNDETIYSAGDQDVRPPQTLETLPGPTISRWTTRTNAMELIVSETGTVERVRLVTPPQRMPDIQVLSVAKVWKFTPAMKDGKPVRYRLLVTWEVNP
jgi:Gram-negative bacterial TonB protein C-terminal